MAPKTQFSKEQIIDAAFDIASTEGIDCITTRKVAEKLGSSIAPIYVNFTEVDDLKRAVMHKAFRVALDILEEQLRHNTPFLAIGVASLRFAREHSVLFRDLMLRPNPYIKDYEKEFAVLLAHMGKDDDLHGVAEEDLQVILLKMRIFTLGLSVMVANDLLTSQFDETLQIELMNSMATDVVMGVLHKSH